MLNGHFKRLFFLLVLSCSLLLVCNQREIKKKLDPNLRLTLRNMKKSAPPYQPILVVFKVNENLTSSHKETLEKDSVHIISNIGQIYTASLPTQKIISLAKLKFIDYIQSSKVFKTASADSISQLPQK